MIRRAPATERAGVIAGLIGSSFFLICVVLFGRTKLLFVVGVAVSTAGSLEVDDGLLSEAREPFVEVATLDESGAGLTLDSSVVEEGTSGVVCCGSFVGSVSDGGLWTDVPSGVGVGGGASCRGRIAYRRPAAWVVFPRRRHNETVERKPLRSIL